MDLGGAAVVMAAVLCLASGRLFVWPAADQPAPCDAVIALGGNDRRARKAESLVAAGYAPTLVIAIGRSQRRPRTDLPGCEVIIFDPEPFSTRGEARYVGALAADRGWKRIMIVPGMTQATRARIRFRRCYAGDLLVVPARDTVRHLPYHIAYEWAALTKALIFQRQP
jgi:hypothetical protein